MCPLIIRLLAVPALFASFGMAQQSKEMVQYDNVTLEVLAEGRGPLVVLLPSLGRDSEELGPLAGAIAAGGFRVLRPQPRGFGGSTGPMEKITLHDLARDVAEVIEHENDGPAIVAGHAFGHFVAKMTAVDFPKLVRGVVLIGAAEKKPDPEVQQAVAIASDPTKPEADRLEALKEVFFAPGNDATPWLKGFHANVRQAEIIARDATPPSAYWSAGKAPILDIQGEDDPYRPPDTSTELLEDLGAKRVTVVRISDAAHAIAVEQPKEVANAIVEWARDLPRER